MCETLASFLLVFLEFTELTLRGGERISAHPDHNFVSIMQELNAEGVCVDVLERVRGHGRGRGRGLGLGRGRGRGRGRVHVRVRVQMPCEVCVYI